MHSQGLVDQWVDFASNEIEYAAITWLGPILGFLNYQKPAVDKAKQHIDRTLAALNEVLLFLPILFPQVSCLRVSCFLFLLPCAATLFSLALFR